MRRPLQGITNIVRFNWPFYALAACLLLIACVAIVITKGELRYWTVIVALCTALPVTVSLVVSLYVYDLSGLYDLRWLDSIELGSNGHFANINAGFDETTMLLRQRYPDAIVMPYDFYDPAHHTEPSIRRARAAYPAHADTITIGTDHISAADGSIDAIFLIFAAHEIRDALERERFFAACYQALRRGGHVIVVEHLRDAFNFAAYSIGFFHFLPLRSWLSVFQATGFKLARRQHINPFVTIFILRKDGHTL